MVFEFHKQPKKHAKSIAIVQLWKSICALYQRDLQLFWKILSGNLDGASVRYLESQWNAIEEYQWVLFFSKVRPMHSAHPNEGYQQLPGHSLLPEMTESGYNIVLAQCWLPKFLPESVYFSNKRFYYCTTDPAHLSPHHPILNSGRCFPLVPSLSQKWRLLAAGSTHCLSAGLRRISGLYSATRPRWRSLLGSAGVWSSALARGAFCSGRARGGGGAGADWAEPPAGASSLFGSETDFHFLIFLFFSQKIQLLSSSRLGRHCVPVPPYTGIKIKIKMKKWCEKSTRLYLCILYNYTSITSYTGTVLVHKSTGTRYEYSIYSMYTVLYRISM